MLISAVWGLLTDDSKLTARLQATFSTGCTVGETPAPFDGCATIRRRIRRRAVGDASTGTTMTKPTIAAVLAQFLAEQERRLSPKTAAQYRDVVELLQHHLNGYAYLSLDELGAKRFERLQHATGDTPREFCEVFGPEQILPNVSEFLGYFMVRKVMASRALLRAAGTVTKRLAAWLAAQGYADAEAAELAAERGAEAARDLPKADELAMHLQAFAEDHIDSAADDQIEDHFQVTRVEPGRIWLTGLLDGRERGPIQLPEELSRRCQIGWTVSGMIGRVGRRWQLIEA
jgi:hypothetical protein